MTDSHLFFFFFLFFLDNIFLLCLPSHTILNQKPVCDERAIIFAFRGWMIKSPLVAECYYGSDSAATFPKHERLCFSFMPMGYKNRNLGSAAWMWFQRSYRWASANRINRDFEDCLVSRRYELLSNTHSVLSYGFLYVNNASAQQCS